MDFRFKISNLRLAFGFISLAFDGLVLGQFYRSDTKQRPKTESQRPILNLKS